MATRPVKILTGREVLLRDAQTIFNIEEGPSPKGRSCFLCVAVSKELASRRFAPARDFSPEWPRLVSLFRARRRARDKTVQSIIRAWIIART